MSTRFLMSLCALTLGSALAQSRPIVVGSKLDPEAQILGQMILQTLKHAGLPVTDKTSLGDTGVLRKAILAGEVDIYPEYTGNAVYFFPAAKISAKQAGNPAQIYKLARDLDAKQGVTWLKPANVNNTWVVAVPEAFAKSARLQSLSDLARYVKGGGKLKVAGSPEFFNRPDTFPAFEKAYGFKLSNAQKLVLAGATPAQTQQAAAQGANGVNAAMAYGTDGTLSALNMVALQDPKGAQAVYQPSPIARAATLRAYPQVSALLEKTFATLDAKTMQRLNGEVSLEGKTPAAVATEYLTSKGLLK